VPHYIAVCGSDYAIDATLNVMMENNAARHLGKPHKRWGLRAH
jgi:hypothetical protein